ncbi:MAG: polymerase subunit gamma/tau [Actinomycetota bacterium]|nr:polymerase subunit gamma/tau [Actinomycetota bacterium]
MAEDQPYQALYRRFRPQRFGELRGQEHVTRALTNAVREGHVAHAYLFSGPRGTGKTSTARILAKALNCTDLQDGEPCGVCESCVQVQQGTSLDVHELDAASNNGVDAMRDLVSRAALGTPGRWKVYIVDEVHMLSTPASNALLKTLEEPPAHVVFVLATTDPQKVLPTIRSRTQHFEFRLIGPEVLVGLLKDVNASAGLGVPVEAIDLAVRRGRGSARDALSVLDQVAAAGMDEDEPTFGDDLVEALADKDVGRALAAVAEGIGVGRDPRRLAEELLAHLRNAFLAVMARSLVDLPDDAAVRVEEQGRRIGPAGLTRAMDAIGDALTDMREALDPRVSLEVAIVRIARPDTDPAPAALLERIERLERGGGRPAAPAAPAVVTEEQAVPAAPAAVAPAAPEGVHGARKALGAVKRARPAPAPVPAPVPPTAAAPAPAADRIPNRDELTAVWADSVMPKLQAKTRAIFAAGRWVDGGADTAAFALPNDVHRGRAEKHRADVEATLAAHFGGRIPLILVVDEGQVTAVPAAPSPEDEHMDLAELADAPPGLTSPEDRLKQAFPGAEEVVT